MRLISGSFAEVKVVLPGTRPDWYARLGGAWLISTMPSRCVPLLPTKAASTTKVLVICRCRSRLHCCMYGVFQSAAVPRSTLVAALTDGVPPSGLLSSVFGILTLFTKGG